MASESDDSFVWTNTSSDSEMAMENGKDESDLDFEIKKELLNDSEKQIEKRSKKRKHETEHTESSHSEQKKQIKSEPESDFERPKKKKKKVRHDSEISRSDKHETINDIDNYLNVRVKEEQESIVESSDVKPKKKKKHKKEKDVQIPDVLESQISCVEDDNTKVVNDSQGPSNQVDDYLNYRVKLEQESFVESNEGKIKKKKSKKSLDASTSEDNHSEINKTHRDSNIEIGDIKKENENPKKNSKKLKGRDKQRECSTESEEIEKSTSKRKKSENLHNENESVEKTLEECNDQLEGSNVNEKSGLLMEDKEESVNKRLSRTSLGSSDGEHPKINRSFSERLRFEEDNTANFESVNEEKVQNWPKQIKQYAKINKHMTLISPKIHGKHTISDDDEVWIIKCPNEFDIKDFKDINLTLDNKCKIKLNGQTYDGAFDDSIQRVPILTSDKNRQKTLIKNVSIMGFTKFRKRLPKIHIPDQATVINNYGNFIPLPETKCRHPLLGVNYKKALKIPPSIAERLNGTIEESSLSESVKKKKKKHKKEKFKSETEGDIEMEQTADEPIISKKKRKRKHSDAVDGPQSEPKRVKQDPDSAEAWESEQAIQNNLFGFE